MTTCALLRSEMKFYWMAFLGLLLLAVQVCAEEQKTLKSEQDKIQYGIGVGVARNFKQQGMEIDLDLVIKGMRDAASGAKLLVGEDELRGLMTAYQSEMRLRQTMARRKAAAENKNTGDAFLTENRKASGVLTMPSGLQYKIVKQGSGKKPVETDTVEVNYSGTLLNGTEFDKSAPGKPAVFKVAGVIAGWSEALRLMPTGSRWQLFIPPQLAYGDRGAGMDIGPNAVLIFDVELVGIK